MPRTHIGNAATPRIRASEAATPGTRASDVVMPRTRARFGPGVAMTGRAGLGGGVIRAATRGMAAQPNAWPRLASQASAEAFASARTRAM
jgi:hypothetical protein